MSAPPPPPPAHDPKTFSIIKNGYLGQIALNDGANICTEPRHGTTHLDPRCEGFDILGRVEDGAQITVQIAAYGVSTHAIRREGRAFKMVDLVGQGGEAPFSVDGLAIILKTRAIETQAASQRLPVEHAIQDVTGRLSAPTEHQLPVPHVYRFRVLRENLSPPDRLSMDVALPDGCIVGEATGIEAPTPNETPRIVDISFRIAAVGRGACEGG